MLVMFQKCKKNFVAGFVKAKADNIKKKINIVKFHKIIYKNIFWSTQSSYMYINHI